MFLSKSSRFACPGILQNHIRLASSATIHGPGACASWTFLFPLYRSKSALGTTTFSTAASSGDSGTTEESGSFRRSHLVKEIAKTHGLSLAKSDRIVKTVFDTIVDAVVDDRRVQLANFGAFESYTSKETTGRNPKNGDKILIPAKKRIRFKAFDSFQKCVREGKSQPGPSTGEETSP